MELYDWNSFGMENMADVMGPGHIDVSVRQLIQVCWASLPKDQRTVAAVEKALREIVERAIRDFREDAVRFQTRIKGIRSP
jgi:hypothetical protein